ncbi:hypothetical protein JQN58_26075 [Aneurinibacillus sp. BA2021]|nr:hypothetical protein [Aneurinibacillus sp. BA2021]
MADAVAAEADGIPVEHLERGGERLQHGRGLLLGVARRLLGHPSMVRPPERGGSAALPAVRGRAYPSG